MNTIFAFILHLYTHTTDVQIPWRNRLPNDIHLDRIEWMMNKNQNKCVLIETDINTYTHTNKQKKTKMENRMEKKQIFNIHQ